MQQPAIQAALDNLVEVIRTALTAEFLEYFRGDAQPVGGKLVAKAAKNRKKTTAKKTTAKKTTAKKTERPSKV